MKILLYSLFGFVVVMTLTWIGARLLGTTLWKKCVNCGSRRTRTIKGWVPDHQMVAEFVKDTECDSCKHRQRQTLPRKVWPRAYSS